VKRHPDLSGNLVFSRETVVSSILLRASVKHHVSRGTGDRPGVSHTDAAAIENVVSHQTGSGIGPSPCFTSKRKSYFTWKNPFRSFVLQFGFAFSRETSKFWSCPWKLSWCHVDTDVSIRTKKRFHVKTTLYLPSEHDVPRETRLFTVEDVDAPTNGVGSNAYLTHSNVIRLGVH
jgi:hypothetical protein